MNKAGDNRYQLFGKLRAEEYDALEADIVKRGVMVAIEKDEDGNTLDGHHREAIAAKHGLTYKTVTRRFKTEEEKREHVIKLNLARRHLEPWQWGQAFAMLLEAKGVERKQGARNDLTSSTLDEVAKEVGVPPETARKRLRAADTFAALPAKEKAAVAKGQTSLADAKRETKRKEVKAKLEDTATKQVKAVRGVYDVIVIDPPWPMTKIERDDRPNQSEFDYPTMEEDALRALTIPAAEDCHVWLWTTHRFLPMAFHLLNAWGLKYVCTFVWHKPGGFQVVGLPQFNCEFAIYARKGAPVFLDTKAFPTCFNAPRGAHSEKPEEFYAMVRRVTAGRRLDLFSRRTIEGFDGWGQEAK